MSQETASSFRLLYESNKIEALIELLKPYGIKEIARTGTTAFARGTQQKASSNKTISIV